MDTRKVDYFLEIVKCQSIGKAAKSLDVSQPFLSKMLKSMEEEVGSQLYIHYDKTFQLTQFGQAFCAYCKRISILKNEFQEKISGMRDFPEGKLCVLASSGVLNFYLVNLLPTFLQNYKDILLSIQSNDLQQSLTLNTDICIGPKIEEEGIESILLLSNQFKIYASKEYLEKKGWPKNPEELDNHCLISYSHEHMSTMMDFDWHLKFGATNGLPRIPFLELGSSYALKKAAENGLGLITFAKTIVDRKPTTLVDVFPDEPGIFVNIYLSYWKEQSFYPPLIKFKDFLLKNLLSTEAE